MEIGKIALTEEKGYTFLITGISPIDEDTTEYLGFLLMPSRYGEAVIETNPREMCDLNDVMDFQKVASQTISLINRESEKREKAQDKVRSLDSEHDDNVIEELSSNDTLSTSL